jgi:hypothetical protein
VDAVFAYFVDGVYVAGEQRLWPAEQAGREAPVSRTSVCLPSYEAVDRSAKAVLHHTRAPSPSGYGLSGLAGTRKDPPSFEPRWLFCEG